MADDQRAPGSDGAVAVVRRAPFSANPRVGTRGQRTQQRILDAALQVFGEEGYHRCSIDRITKVGGCSRVSFYQYFASKEDVFRHLGDQVARQLRASTEAMDPLTADADGWSAMRTWIARYREIYERYEPIFHAYQAALESDESFAAFAEGSSEQIIGRFHSRLVTVTLPSRQLEPVIKLLLATMSHTLDVVGILRAAAPDDYPTDRVDTAIADVMHRTLFGLRPEVNVHEGDGPVPPALPFPPAMRALFDAGPPEPDRSAKGALAALLATGRDVFVGRGYHNTRIDDLVAAAGVSHGAFYRHFRSKDQLARILTAQALRAVGTELLEMPDAAALDDSATRNVLRRWLRRYNDVHANEAAMLRVWVDAVLQQPALRAESAPPLDWGRRRTARYLRPRGFGDIEMDAVVTVAMLGVFGLRPRPAAGIDAAVHVVERGLLGRVDSEGADR
jgi:AcrR family transcriptional regulator